MNKILTIPNILAFSRIIFFAPLVIYFLLTGQNILAFITTGIVIFTDVIDGFIARKRKQESELGAYLDAFGDHIFIAAYLLASWYLAYIDLVIIVFVAFHRVIRLLANFYWHQKTKEFFNPFYLKVTGYIVYIYIYLIPILALYFGAHITKIIGFYCIFGSLFLLIIGIIYAYFKNPPKKLSSS